MALQLYDTLSRKKRRFEPAERGKAKIYVCGPTVYDYSHLGHVRCYVIYDVLVRHLRASGLEVTYVRNFTDVDDKILKRSAERNQQPLDLSMEFEQAFRQDMQALGNLPADIEPKVSEHIPEIIALIQRLIDNGSAYAVDGDVYFEVSKFKDYGKLSHRKQQDMLAGASGRTHSNEETLKKHAADFALWKASDPGELSWDSPWGPGRPGWHIECSAMSMRYLGESLDLHGGGLDLVFPHHENEIAQSEAATGKVFSGCWMHNGFVEVSQQKMSKSLGNFFTAREVFKFAEPEAIRYFVLTMHYRAPLNLDWNLDEAGQVTGFPQIEEAEKRIEYLYGTKKRLQLLSEKKIKNQSSNVGSGLQHFESSVTQALDDDLNTPKCFAALSDFLCACNETLDAAAGKKGTVNTADVQAMRRGFDVLQIHTGFGSADPDLVLSNIRRRRANQRGLDETNIEQAIQARSNARLEKKFEEADRIRQELLEKGVELMDGPQGTSWRINA